MEAAAHAERGQAPAANLGADQAAAAPKKRKKQTPKPRQPAQEGAPATERKLPKASRRNKKARAENPDTKKVPAARKQYPATFYGVPFMLFRVLVHCSVSAAKRFWQSCTSTTEGHVADSYVHRYDREIGFANLASRSQQQYWGDDDSAEPEDAEVAATEREARSSGAGKNKSHAQRVTRMSQFERYVLDRHPASKWAKWLLGLGVGGEQPLLEDTVQHLKAEAKTFVPPPVDLVRAYIINLRKDRLGAKAQVEKPDHKGGTIRVRVHVGGIGPTCKA